MNCFQHTPESRGALHSPCGGAPQQRGPLTPQTQTRPNRLHTHTHPPKRLAHPRSPIPPLSILTSRATHAHPTSSRSTGFCAIWGCISSSSSPVGARGWRRARGRRLRGWRGHRANDVNHAPGKDCGPCRCGILSHMRRSHAPLCRSMLCSARGIYSRRWRTHAPPSRTPCPVRGTCSRW